MGCCTSQNQDPSNMTYYNQKFKEAIDLCHSNKVLLYTKLREKSTTCTSLDDTIVTINNKLLSPLAYSVHSGNTKMFEFLLSLGASQSSMEAQLESQGLQAMNMICSKNFTELAQVYLPLYLKSRSFSSLFEFPIHAACRAGSLGIIKFIQSYFALASPPPEFDLTTLNEKGENSALVACRFGNLDVVRYLREVCRMDLQVLNKNKENAVIVAVSGYKNTPKLEYYDLVVYLVNEVKIDIRYMHEYLLQIVDNSEILSFFEEKLEKLGIFCRNRESRSSPSLIILSDNSEKVNEMHELERIV